MNYSPLAKLKKKNEEIHTMPPTSPRRTSPRFNTRKNLDLSTPPTLPQHVESGETSDSNMTVQHHLPASSHLQHAVFRNAYDGNTRVVLEMLEREPRLIDEIGELNNGTCYAPSTILHFACRGGHINMAYELVKVFFVSTIFKSIYQSNCRCNDYSHTTVAERCQNIGKKPCGRYSARLPFQGGPGQADQVRRGNV